MRTHPAARRLGFGGLAVVAIALPFLLSGSYLLNVVDTAGIYILVVFGVDLVFGRAKMLSLGNAALFAVGAFASAALVIAGVPFLVAMVLAAVIAALFGILVALPALRLSGLHLAVASFVLVLFVSEAGNQWIAAHGEDGIAVPGASLGSFALDTDFRMYWFWLAVVVAVLVFSAGFLNRRVGRAFTAIGDAPLAAEAMGISVRNYRVLAFVLSGAVSGLAGAMYASFIRYLDPTTFAFPLVLTLSTMVVLGGVGRLSGPVIGAFFVTLAPQLLVKIPGVNADAENAFFGVVLIIVLIFMPGGFAEGLDRLEHWAAKLLGRVRAPATPVTAGASDRVLVEEIEPARRTRAEEIEPARSRHAEEIQAARGSAPLSLSDVSVRFGGLVALDAVSVDVQARSVHGLIGPNGAGKSTLLNCISGFVSPAQGRIELAGRNITELAPAARARAGIGRTFQNLQLFGSVSVMDNLLIAQHTHMRGGILGQGLRLPAVRRSEEEARRIAEDTLELLEIGWTRDRRAADLPYATQKTVELARALTLRPRVLLLDEPATGMNHQEVRRMIRHIRFIRDEFDVTVVLIEHNMRMVMEVCDTITVLSFGRRLAEGSPAEIRGNADVIEAYLGPRVDDLADQVGLVDA